MLSYAAGLVPGKVTHKNLLSDTTVVSRPQQVKPAAYTVDCCTKVS